MVPELAQQAEAFALRLLEGEDNYDLPDTERLLAYILLRLIQGED